MQRQVIIDCFPESGAKYKDGYVVVAIDVIRATTSAISAVASGRRCITVHSLEAMLTTASSLENPLLVGELGGDMPAGCDMNNSPYELLQRTDRERPMVLLSTSGTRLVHEARAANLTLLAAFRNWEATARYILENEFERVALVGAGSRGEFREEDQMCCAWIADYLLHAGFTAANAETSEIAERWRGTTAEACQLSNSVKYLLKSGQVDDLEFVLEHVNDLTSVFIARGLTAHGHEIVECKEEEFGATDFMPATLASSVTGKVAVGSN